MKYAPIFLLVAVLSAPAAFAAGEAPEGLETFQANVVSVSSPQGMITDTLMLRVEKWTKPEEARVLLNLLGEKGMEAFHKAINEQNLGSLSATATIGWPINLATSEWTAEGRSIRLILERPLLHREIAHLERSAEYPFVVVEFTMDAKGGGKGRVVPAAKLRLGPKGELEILPYSEPNEQRILSVKKVER